MNAPSEVDDLRDRGQTVARRNHRGRLMADLMSMSTLLAPASNECRMSLFSALGLASLSGSCQRHSNIPLRAKDHPCLVLEAELFWDNSLDSGP